jgi:flotillin
MDYTVFIYAGIIVLAIILTVLGLVSCFKKCPSDKLLVVFGWIPGKKKNKGTITDETGAKRAAKVYPGGGVFVIPGLQSYKTMDMLPYKIISHIKGPDKGMVVTHVDVALTTAISTDPVVQVNAANRFLTASPEAIEEQIKIILDGTIRDIVATMPIEDLNNNRNAFTTEISETLKPKLNNIGFAILDINIQNIQDEDQYLVNLGKKKVTEAKANALADIADKERVGQVRIAQIEQEKAVKIAEADRDKETQVREAQKSKAVRIAEINRDQGIETATATKDQETGIAAQAAEQKANVARSEADGEIGEAKAYADAKAQVAKANADAIAAENEALAEQEIRIAQAAQKQEAETAKATQEAEARKAEYKSNKEQRQAVAEQNAGVARENAKVKVAEAAGEAGIAEAKRDKDIKSAQVDANMTVARIQQERDCEVNEAKAKATEAKLNAEKIVPAQIEKETILINADATKQQVIIQAEAEAEAIRKKAEAEAAAIRLKKEAEAAGVEALGKAEGAREEAISVGKARGVQQEALAEAMKYERMIQAAGGDVGALTQLMLSERVEAGYNALTHQFEALRNANITVVGNPSTAGDLIGTLVSKGAPALQLLNDGLKKQVMDTFGFGKKTEISEKTVEGLKKSEK